jgi:dipeptidyl aminopeptidase/acylaminoacyl peptidase
MLIVQGQEDDTVPISDSLRLSKAWAGRSDVVVIKGGDHSLTDLVHMGIYIALACHWIAS